MNFSHCWGGRKSDEGSDKGRYFDGIDDVIGKEGDRRYYRAGDRRALRDPETDLLHSNPGIANMSVEKQNFISRAYSRVFVGLFLDWVSNGKKAKNLDCFLDARILVEGGIEGVLKKT